MKAVIKTKPEKGNVELKDVQIPRIGHGEVLIRSKAAPIGSDVRVFKSDPVMMRVTRPPVIIGSENSGEIMEVDAAVKGWKPGDRVVCELVVDSCGHCYLCKMGRPFMCKEVVLIGRGRDGSFAGYYVASPKYLHRIPDGVSFEEGAMAEDLGVVITAIDDSRAVGVGDTVVVMGPGPMGLLSLQVTRACGAGHVVVTGTDADEMRLELASQLGADRILNVEQEDLGAYIDEFTNCEGVDVVILANSSGAAIQQGFSIMKKYGTMVALGFPPGPTEIPFYEITAKALRVFGGWGASSWKAWERALQCISSGTVNVNPLVTHTFPLEDWKEAFDTFSTCKGLKVQLIP